MKSPALEIGKSLQIEVTWYDKVLVPPADRKHPGEVIGWRQSQVIVSVQDYAVLRFWKKNGLEVGNKDFARRGFSISIAALAAADHPPAAPGIPINFDDE